MNKTKISEKLFATILVLAITMSLLSGSIGMVVAENVPTKISVTVQDIYTGSKLENARVTIIKRPFKASSIDIIDEASTTLEKGASFSLNKGEYSVSGYHPDFGHAVKVVKITEDNAGKDLHVTLKLKPVAENWTDSKGVTHRKLISWPDPQSFSETESSAKSQKSYFPGISILLDEAYFYQRTTKIGEVYSTEGLTVELDLKFSSSIQTKLSINGGPLSVYGSNQNSTADVVNLPSLSDGASRSLYNWFDYVYQYWYYTGVHGHGKPFCYEVWKDCKIYGTSAFYDTPYPTPSYKSLPPDDIMDATDTPSYQTKQVIKTYSTYEGAGWSVGTSVTLSGAWNIFSGSVSLGGSYSFSSYTGGEDVYTLNLQGGRVVNIYEWNNAGGGAAGIVLTFQKRYWVSSIVSSGWISGGGGASDANNLTGKSNDGDPARIYAGNYGDAGYIEASMNTAASGNIYVYGFSQNGYYNSHLYTYVSSNGNDWDLAGQTYVDYQDGLHYINAGYYAGTFNYISFVGYNDNGFSIELRLDAVHVVK